MKQFRMMGEEGGNIFWQTAINNNYKTFIQVWSDLNDKLFFPIRGKFTDLEGIIYEES